MRWASLAATMFASTALAAAPGAFAGVTDPSLCTVDSFLVACPAGDLVFHSIMRQVDGTPQNSPDETWLELCGCAEIRFADPLPTDGYTLVGGCRPTTNLVPGVATADFPLRAGGVCSGATIWLRSGDVMVRLFGSLASPDQDGDLFVDAADRALLMAKLAGPYDPTADLDGDRVLGPADLAVFEQHLGHASERPTSAPAWTWGRLKNAYR